MKTTEKERVARTFEEIQKDCMGIIENAILRNHSASKAEICADALKDAGAVLRAEVGVQLTTALFARLTGLLVNAAKHPAPVPLQLPGFEHIPSVILDRNGEPVEILKTTTWCRFRGGLLVYGKSTKQEPKNCGKRRKRNRSS